MFSKIITFFSDITRQRSSWINIWIVDLKKIKKFTINAVNGIFIQTTFRPLT